ncbi:MAG: HPF/RaiA family ribosome-associated protein [Bacteroidota bacterium]
MEILIESPFQLVDRKKESIEESIRELVKHDAQVTQAQVYFKTFDALGEENKCTAVIQLHVPGPVIFASADAPSDMEAFSLVCDKVERILRKARDMRNDHQENKDITQMS